MAETIRGRKAREQRERMLLLKHKFDTRISTTRIGKQALDSGNYTAAVQHFMDYMTTVAEAKKAKDIYSLKPGHFDPKKDLTEMLMISHLYFELARIYDAVPKFAEDSKRCLDQFVLFSANQPYQVVNSELIRKHLKKSLFKNPANFRTAHEQIYIQSKQCYIVTFCYGGNDPITHQYRQLKDLLLDYRLGQEIVRIYYTYSSRFVPKLEKGPWAKFTAIVFIRPLLGIFANTILRFILPKC